MVNKLWNDKLYRNSMFLIINSALMALFGFVFWSLAARMFYSEDVGLATVVISAVSLVSSLSLLGFNIALLKYKDKLLNFNALVISSTVSLVSAFILLILNDKLSFLNSNYIYSLSFIIFCLFNTLYSLLGSILISQNKQYIVLLKDSLFSVLKVFFALILSGLIGLLWSWFIGIFAALVLSLFFITLEFKFSLSSLKKISLFSFYNYLSSLLNSLPSLLLPIIIVHCLSPSYSAYFYVSWMIANLLFIVPSSVSQNLLSDGDVKKLRKSLLFSILLLGLGIIAVLIFGSLILSLFNPEYSAGLTLLYILALSSIPYGVRQVYNSYFNVQEKYLKVVILNLIVVVITIVGSLIFRNLEGIGLSWLVANIIAVVGTLIWK